MLHGCPYVIYANPIRAGSDNVENIYAFIYPKNDAVEMISLEFKNFGIVNGFIFFAYYIRDLQGTHHIK